MLFQLSYHHIARNAIRQAKRTMEPPEVVEVGDERRLAFDINLRHTWVAPLFVKLVWSVSGFEAKGRIKNQRVLAIAPKKTSSSWIALIWWVSMVEEEESSFDLPLVLAKNQWFPAIVPKKTPSILCMVVSSFSPKWLSNLDYIRGS